MNRTHVCVLVSTMLAMCAGCFDTQTTVRIKADGSGTVEERFLVTSTVVAQMKAFSQSMVAEGGQAQAADAFSVYKPDDLRAAAAKMGEGVTFVSSEPIKTDKGEGYRAVYAFEDINKLRLNQNPGDEAPSAGAAQQQESPEEFITFAFKKGRTSTLTIRRPSNTPGDDDEKATPEEAAKDSADTKQALEQVKQIFDGMRVAMFIEVDGKLVKTNATHVDGNRITLMDMNFDQLMQNPEKLETFALSKPKSVEEAKKILKGVDGMKVDMNEELVVSFR
ncbi:MAG: hypothetical protein GF331_19465 [Chitinivibrionales bacterium]|nr:hypothetical protein [Chitinivibrionales bacterium]